MEADYKVKLEVFEGPLDLLLYLIRRDEIDIYDIPIEHITRQYLEYLEIIEELDLDIAGEFVVMAANLIHIKSRSLLPVAARADEEPEEDADPRWELVRQLLEYKKFKEASAHLSGLEQRRAALFPLLPGALDAAALEQDRPLAEVSVFDLIHAFQRMLKRMAQKAEEREIYAENYTVSDKIEYLLQLVAPGVMLKFSELFTRAVTRVEVVVTFLALLELIRLKQLTVTQAEPFAEIEVCRSGEF